MVVILLQVATAVLNTIAYIMPITATSMEIHNCLNTHVTMFSFHNKKKKIKEKHATQLFIQVHVIFDTDNFIYKIIFLISSCYTRDKTQCTHSDAMYPCRLHQCQPINHVLFHVADLIIQNRKAALDRTYQMIHFGLGRRKI